VDLKLKNIISRPRGWTEERELDKGNEGWQRANGWKFK
jgi:hypothetical protein